MICAEISKKNGAVVITNPQPATIENCSLVIGVPSDYLGTPDFSAIGITPGEVGQVYLAGFGLVIAGWVLGLAVGWIGRAIRLL